MRHDLASHLAVINSLCENGNYDEIRKYAKQLSHDDAYSGGKILTGNQIADLVVGSKMKTAKEHGCGIEIMKQLAQKYHGSYAVSCNDTAFELKIMLLK